MALAVVGEEEPLVVDVAAPTAELAAFVVAEGDPVGIGGQLLEAGLGNRGRSQKEQAHSAIQGNRRFGIGKA